MITLMSFGFKYGPPAANYYFDVGFIKNPARQTKWSFFSSWDSEIDAFVMDQPETREFIRLIMPLIKFLDTIDQHQIIAFGCSAGRHRSPIIVTHISKLLLKEGINVNTRHRDLG